MQLLEVKKALMGSLVIYKPSDGFFPRGRISTSRVT
jgi:hypothetical protein